MSCPYLPAMDEVHVWCIGLAQRRSQRPVLQQLLSEDEQQRALRFHFPQDCERFVIARAMLRKILAAYLGGRAKQLRFAYGCHGKPSLLVDTGKSPLQFNLSHSSEFVVYAITQSFSVGIDIERVRASVEWYGLARHFFSPAEVKALQMLPAGSHPVGFFNCWTRKEAFVKATGNGLSHRLDDFDVSLTPGEPAALLRLGSNSSATRAWKMHAFSPSSEYVAAVAVKAQQAIRLTQCEWPLNN